MANLTFLPKVVDMSSSLDGSEVSFTLPDSILSGSLEVFINGLRLTPGTDFTVSGRVFTLVDAPAADENMVVKYFPAKAVAAAASSGYASTPRQVADQFGTPRIMYD